MSTTRSLSKSPLQVAEQAFRVARRALPLYGARTSRKDFTLAQLLSLLVLKTFFKTDYRGIVQMVDEWSELRAALELEKVPHYTTLQKAQARLAKKTGLPSCFAPCLPTP